MRGIGQFELYLEQHLVLETRSAGGSILVALVLHGGLGAHAEGLLPALADLHALFGLARFQPKGHAVLRFADGNDRAANLVARRIDGLADDGQDGEEPRFVQPAALGLLLGDGQDELAPVDVGLVLPHGLDALDEDVVVGVGAEGAGRLDVVEHLPEGLDGRERPALLEVVPPRRPLRRQPRIVEPEHPLAVQRRLGHAVFFLRHILMGCAGRQVSTLVRGTAKKQAAIASWATEWARGYELNTGAHKADMTYSTRHAPQKTRCDIKKESRAVIGDKFCSQRLLGTAWNTIAHRPPPHSTPDTENRIFLGLSPSYLSLTPGGERRPSTLRRISFHSLTPSLRLLSLPSVPGNFNWSA